jgi:hypothetical protein
MRERARWRMSLLGLLPKADRSGSPASQVCVPVVFNMNHAILPALFCSFYYRSAVVQRRVARQSETVNQDSTPCAAFDAFYKSRTGGRTSPQHPFGVPP